MAAFSKRIWAALLSLTLASVHQAQVVVFDVAEDRELGESYFLFRHGSFGRTCAVELNGDFRLDAMVLAGDELVCTFSPGIYHSLATISGAVVDMCPLPAVDPKKRGSVLLTSDRERLERWRFDVESRAFRVEPLGAPVWADVTELNAADLTGDGLDDVVGVTPDRSSLIWLASPFHGEFEQFRNVQATIHRAVPIEWDGGAGSELALLTSDGLLIQKLDGSRLFRMTTDGDDSDRMCVVRASEDSAEKLALLVEEEAGYSLVVVGAQGVEAALPMGALEPVAMASGDHDGDGFGDLCISHKGARSLFYFHNQATPGLATFDWADSEIWDPTPDESGSTPAPENEAHPLIVDLDQDDDGDLYFPLESAGFVSMLRSDFSSHLDRAPSVTEPAYEFDVPTQRGLLRLTLTQPQELPAGNRLQVVVWKQATLQGDTRTESDPVYRTIEGPLTWPLQIEIALAEPLATPTLFHGELRVAHQVLGKLVDGAATAVWTFTTSDASKEDMITFFGVERATILETPIDLLGGGGGGGGEPLVVPSGWTGPMPCIPCFADDEVPDFNQGDRFRILPAIPPSSNAIKAK